MRFGLRNGCVMLMVAALPLQAAIADEKADSCEKMAKELSRLIIDKKERAREGLDKVCQNGDMWEDTAGAPPKIAKRMAQRIAVICPKNFTKNEYKTDLYGLCMSIME